MRKWMFPAIPAVMAFVVACGGGTPVEPTQQLAQAATPDIEATVIAAIEATAQAIPPPTPTATPEPTPFAMPTPTPTAIRPTLTPIPSPTVAPIQTPIPTPTLAQIIEKAIKAVVLIKAGDASGSGFVFDQTGWVLTNAHVVGDSLVVAVSIDGRVYEGGVIGIHEDIDLAVIWLNSNEVFSSLSFADSDQAKLTEDVITIGYPLTSLLGDDVVVTKGIVSSKRRIDKYDYIQTDAVLNPGNSGGPLLNRNGEVIGINTARVERILGRSVEGTGLAIAINEATNLIDFLKGGGMVLAAPTMTPTPTFAFQPFTSLFPPLLPIPKLTPTPTSTPIPTPQPFRYFEPTFSRARSITSAFTRDYIGWTGTGDRITQGILLTPDDDQRCSIRWEYNYDDPGIVLRIIGKVDGIVREIQNPPKFATYSFVVESKQTYSFEVDTTVPIYWKIKLYTEPTSCVP